MKKPKLKRDWEGLKVRSLAPLINGWAEMPAGNIFTVMRNYGGLHLRSEPCSCCGAKFFITKVPENAVEIIS